MTASQESFGARFLRMAGVGLAAGMIAVGLGYFPTLRLAGPKAIPAMLAGAAVAVAAGWIGALPVCQTGGDAAARVNRMLAATSLRLVAAVVLALVVGLAGWFDKTVLLLWVAIAYLATLAAETLLFVRWAKAATETTAGPSDSTEE